MSLSSGEWDLVLKAFGCVKADAAGNGGEVLRRLFKAHPATIQLFPKFRSLSEAEIQESAAVSNHGATVINKLGDLLSRRGEYGAELKPMAQSHAHTHKIPLENFTLISEVIVQLMKEKVAGFGGDSEAAMRKALAALVTDLQGLYKELGFKG